MTTPSPAVEVPFRRLVFYLSGFDPRGVRYYYGLFRGEAAHYAALANEVVDVSPRQRSGKTLSTCTADNRTARVTLDLRFLRWEDIVSKAWIRDPLDLAWRAGRAYLNYLRHLDWPWVRTLPRGPLVTLSYPPLLSAAVPALIALALAPLLMIWVRWFLAFPLALAVGVAASIPLLARIKAYWLLRFFVFNSEQAGGSADPAIAGRLDQFAKVIGEALGQADADEILLVAHSNGSILAMPLMDRLIERLGPDLPDRFALVTLGHCIPLVSARKDATAYHSILRRVAAARFRWLDVGSPNDGAAYHGVDPLLKHAAGSPRTPVRLLSPRWHRFFDRDPGKVPWTKKYDNHFNYLRTAERISPIDFPSLLLSRRTLDEAVAAFEAIR